MTSFRLAEIVYLPNSSLSVDFSESFIFINTLGKGLPRLSVTTPVTVIFFLEL